MVRERFDDSFERLRDQSNRLASTPREADNLDEIVQQRVELDRRRAETTKERKRIVSRFEPPATDPVEPPRGYVHTRLFGKIAAGISVGLLVLATFLVVSIVRTIGRGVPLELEQVTESVDTNAGCLWQVTATLRNDADYPVEIQHMKTALDGRFQLAMLDTRPTLQPGGTATVTATWNLLNSVGCSEVDDIAHGNLVIALDNGASVSRGF